MVGRERERLCLRTMGRCASGELEGVEGSAWACKAAVKARVSNEMVG